MNSNDLIARYIQAVKNWLPEKLHAEFLPELEDDLRSQVEEESTKLGRTLNNEEMEALLKRRGHPMLTATRFLPHQFLIGPTWYPIYRFTLRAIVIWIITPVFVFILAPLAAISSNEPFAAFTKVLFQLPFTALTTAAVITFIIAGVERLQLKISPFECWNPAHLPAASPQGATRHSRIDCAMEMACGMFLVLWLLGLFQLPPMAPINVTLGPVWEAVYWPMWAVGVGSMALATAKLFQPWWRPAHGIIALGLSLMGLLIAGWLMGGEPIVNIAGPAHFEAKAAKVKEIIHWSVQIGLLVAMVSCCWTMFVEARRLVGRRLKTPARLVAAI
jgi:hypothetical protein